MDKQEAIERLKQNKAAAEFYAGMIQNTNAIENELKDIEAIDMAIEALTEKTGEWIPVSERLPENNGRYLVAYEGIIGMRTNILIYGVPSPLHTRGAEKCFYDTDREYGDVPYEDVVAWMPLPEPYKGGDVDV